MKQSKWTHPKKPNREYKGSYQNIYGQREFVLLLVKSKSKGANTKIVFESHEAAKALGWKKSK